MTSLNSRLSTFINHLNISINEFEKRTNLSTGLINKAIREERSIGSDKLIKIFLTFKELSPDWLFTGEGEMIRKEGEEVKNMDSDLKQEEKSGCTELEKKLADKEEQIQFLKENTRALTKQIEFLQKVIEKLQA